MKIKIKEVEYDLIDDNTANCRDETEVVDELKKDLINLVEKYKIEEIRIGLLFLYERIFLGGGIIGEVENPDIHMLGYLGKISVDRPSNPLFPRMGHHEEDESIMKHEIDRYLMAKVCIAVPRLIPSINKDLAVIAEKHKDFLKLEFVIEEKVFCITK